MAASLLSDLPKDPKALPSLTKIDLDEEGRGVWGLLLDAEQTALRDYPSVDPDTKYSDHLIGVRVIGHFLKEFWDRQHQYRFFITAYQRLCQEIASCCNAPNATTGNADEAPTQHEQLFLHGLFYRSYLICVSVSTSCPNHCHYSYFNETERNVLSTVTGAPKTRIDVKQQALIRDGHRCTISGLIDLYEGKTPGLLEKVKATGGTNMTSTTQYGYIFPRLAQNLNKSWGYAEAAFMLDEVVNEIFGQNGNNLCNVLTMTTYVCTYFNRFKIWLEEVPGQPYVYTVCSPFPVVFMFPAMDEDPEHKTTFTINSDAEIPRPQLPDRRLLAIRAACSRVAYASGVTEQLDQILDDQEDIQFLLTKGSTAHVLQTVLCETTAFDSAEELHIV